MLGCNSFLSLFYPAESGTASEKKWNDSMHNRAFNADYLTQVASADRDLSIHERPIVPNL